jgi:hypothetical protein
MVAPETRFIWQDLPLDGRLIPQEFLRVELLSGVVDSLGSTAKVTEDAGQV